MQPAGFRDFNQVVGPHGVVIASREPPAGDPHGGHAGRGQDALGAPARGRAPRATLQHTVHRRALRQDEGTPHHTPPPTPHRYTRI